MLSTLFVVALVGLVAAVPTAVDETPICFGKYDGICVKKTDSCPFTSGSEEIAGKSGEKMCRFDTQRCCKPKSTSEVPQERNSKCGISLNSKFKVFGGWRSMPGEWPWQAAIEKDGAHHCGGAFIHPNWVLTAAHCTYFYSDTPLNKWRIRAGKTVLNQKEDYEQNMEVLKIIDHPGFTMFSKVNDIALIQLKKPVFFDYKYVSPVCLPNPGESMDDLVCTLSGFGKTEHGPEASNFLLEVNLPLVGLDTCQEKHCHTNAIVHENVCAGFKAGTRDACQGDSGGPLVCEKVTAGSGIRQQVLAGVVSYGNGCGSKDLPGIYTRVSSYLDWIEFETGMKVASGKYTMASEFVPPEVKAVQTDKCQ